MAWPVDQVVDAIRGEIIDPVTREIDNVKNGVESVARFAEDQVHTIEQIASGNFDIADKIFESARILGLGDLRGKGSLSGPIEMLRSSPIHAFKDLGENLNAQFPQDKMQSIDLVLLRRSVSYSIDICESSLRAVDRHAEHDELSQKIYDTVKKVTSYCRKAEQTLGPLLVEKIGNNSPVVKWLEFPFDINEVLQHVIDVTAGIRDFIDRVAEGDTVQKIRKVLLSVMKFVPRVCDLLNKLMTKIADAFPLNVNLGGSFGVAAANFEPAAQPVSLTKTIAGMLAYVLDLIEQAAGGLKDFVETYIREKPKEDPEQILIDKIADAVVAKLNAQAAT